MTKPATTNLPPNSDTLEAFPAALVAYRNAYHVFATHPSGQVIGDVDPVVAEDDERASTLCDRAFEALIATPSPDGAALAIKLETLMVEYEDCPVDQHLLKALANDARRLGGASS